jgi:hypothetical protein
LRPGRAARRSGAADDINCLPPFTLSLSAGLIFHGGIVAQVIDELEHRRATGKADYVEALADEVQRGGIAAWKLLRDLLPRDEDVPSGSPTVGIGQLFIAAHKEIAPCEGSRGAKSAIH